MPSNTFTKTSALTLIAAMAFSAFTPVTSANAGGRHHGKFIAAGAIGLALGAIIADSSQRRYRRADRIYYNAPVYIPPAPIYVTPQPYIAVQPRHYHRHPQVVHPKYRNDIYPTYGNDTRSKYGKRYPRTYPRHVQKRYPSAPVSPYDGPKVITYEQTLKSNVEPWSPQWRSYCRSKFRSFNAKSGTYLGYDGKRHFCVVK